MGVGDGMAWVRTCQAAGEGGAGTGVKEIIEKEVEEEDEDSRFKTPICGSGRLD